MGNVVLGRRALNRATLERQLLLRRWDLTVPEALERVAGFQSQSTHSWYLGFWSRLAGYRPEPTGELLKERGIVRMALMRSTIHLVTPDDCAWLRPLVQPVIERMTRGNFGRGVAGLDVDELTAAARELMAEKPMMFSELGRRLAERWPEHDPASMAQTVRALVPLVQVPPRGVWGESGQATHVPIEDWLGRSVDPAASLETLVLRYLAAFGPSSVRDVQHWCGLTRLQEVVNGLRPKLEVFQDETGRELFDLPDAPRPDPDTPAPVRFLYEYDNLLRSHADVTRVTTADFGSQGFGGMSGEEASSVLVDGFVSATWRISTARGKATMRIRPFRALTPAEQESVVAEAHGVLDFSAAKAKEREILIDPPSEG